MEGSICQKNAASRSSNNCLLEHQMEEDNPTTSKCVLGVQKKAIAAVVGGLLEKELKGHVGAPQLVNVISPPYLRNKQ